MAEATRPAEQAGGLQPAGARAEPLLGPAQGLFAYGVLLFGFLMVGAASQGVDVVAGLWLSEALAIALPALIWLRAAGVRPGPYLGLQAPPWKWLLIAAATGLLNQPVVSLLEQAAHSFAPADWVREFDAKNAFLEQVFRDRALAFTLTVAVAAPLGEELFFRGFLQPALGRRLRPVAAALISGALFAGIHFDRVGFVGLMEIGVWLAVLRWASGSLWVAVLGHAVNNGVAAASFLLGWQDPNAPPPGWMLASGGVLLVAGLLLGARALGAPTPAPAAEVPAEGAPDRLSHARAAALWFAWSLAVLGGAAKLAGIWK